MAVPESATATAQPPLVPESAQAPPLPPLEGLSATAEAETTTAAAVAPTPAPTPALTLEFRLPDTAVDEALTAEDDGKFKQAVAAYQDALKTDPADTRAWMGLGRLYWRQGQKDYALQCYEQVLRLNPGDTELKAWLDKARQHQAGTP
jgi:cytochrome c-type biogenesis protein CcmH/NrfG